MTDLGPLCVRQATQLGIDYPQRIIELVVVPYDTEALVDQPYGRPVLESIAPGSFSGVETRPNRIRVNRDHQLQRTVGKAVSLHPSRTDGLVAKVKIARTELGDETLALAAEDCLDASAAFRPHPDHMQWTAQRNRVRLTKCWLEHIGMTPDPAYEGANVLTVRHRDTRDEPRAATPNLDRLRADILAERYAGL